MLIEYLLTNWRYKSAPEGQRPFEKIGALAKYGVGGSLFIGIYDSMLLSQTQTFWTTVNCMSYWMVPITAMCVTFASVAYTATNIRGKDDYLNYALASLACGGIFHQWQKKGLLSCHFVALLLIVTKIKKHCDLIGLEPIPLGYNIAKTSYMKFPDMTLTKDLRGPRPWER